MNFNDAISQLGKYFNVIAVIHVTQYDWQPFELYKLLSTLKKDYYNPNDRIIFVFEDTDYYLNGQGFTIRNIQKILYNLDIPNYFCIILTSQTYLKQEVVQINREIGHDTTNIDVIDIWLDIYLKIDEIPKIDLNLNLIEKSFIFLSRVTRKHRVLLFSLLAQANLLDQGMVSMFLGKETPIQPSNATNEQINTNHIQMLSTIPFTRCNETWLLNSNLNSVYDQFITQAIDSFKFKNFVEIYDNDMAVRANSNITQQAFLYIAAETMFSYPGPFVSEKSFKGIAAKRPFVMVGPPGNLKKLQEYGFQTFSFWWDESYDSIEDHSDRMIAVFNIIKEISQMSTNELITLGKDMANVLEYNYNFLINEFTASQSAKLDIQCQNNLNRYYVQN